MQVPSKYLCGVTCLKHVTAAWLLVCLFFATAGHTMDESDYGSMAILVTVVEEIKNNYVTKLDTSDLMQHAVEGIMQHLDPHSMLLTPDHFAAIKEQTQGAYTGVGLYLTMVDEKPTVKGVAPDSPAQRAGLNPGDQILKIDNRATDGMPLWEIEKRLKGPEGTPLVLTTIKKGSETAFTCRMQREMVSVKSVRSAMLDPAGLGYLLVLRFSDNTTSDVVDALENLESSPDGLKGLIIDLRNNPGGPLEQAVGICDLFLENGNIVTVKGRHPKYSKKYDAGPGEIQRSYPIVVLINGGSASSAEIVAGALQDHQRAVIAGTPSFGKGSVQTVVPLPRGFGLKYTTALYYTPAGRSIQDRGIQPDIEISENVENYRKSPVHRALTILKGQVN